MTGVVVVPQAQAYAAELNEKGPAFFLFGAGGAAETSWAGWSRIASIRGRW